MYTYVIKVRSKMFKLGKPNAEFSHVPAVMCFQKPLV